MPQEALKELREPLVLLGKLWAESQRRPRPRPDILNRWDKLLDDWISRTDLPLILRNSGRRNQRVSCGGREIIFGDNTAANWSFEKALAGDVPDIQLWNNDNIADHVPLTFVTKGHSARRKLNKDGWKVCHIDPVSDRKRRKIEDVSLSSIEDSFRRFMSPRNIFLIPILISGAGEIREVIEAVAAFDRAEIAEDVSE